MTSRSMRDDWAKSQIQVIDNLVEKHFTHGTSVHERKGFAEQFLRDTEHHLVNHQGLPQAAVRANLVKDFGDPGNIKTAMRKYNNMGISF